MVLRQLWQCSQHLGAQIEVREKGGQTQRKLWWVAKVFLETWKWGCVGYKAIEGGTKRSS
eukprot:7440246-Pyramimonas_sp.AAC.1